MTRWAVLIVLLVVSVWGTDAYRFGVFPHMPLKKLHEVYSVMLRDLEGEIGHPVHLMSRPYYALYREELMKGLYDVAFIQPMDYVDAVKTQGYMPIARRSNDLHAILVVMKDSVFGRVEDVKNSTIAAAPAEAAVTQLMLQSLEKKGFHVLDEFTISYSKNHFTCLEKVLANEAQACVTSQRALEYFERERGKDTFKTIYTSEPIPHALFVVHPRVPAAVRSKLQERLLHWKEMKQGRESIATENLFDFSPMHGDEYERLQEFMKTSR